MWLCALSPCPKESPRRKKKPPPIDSCFTTDNRSESRLPSFRPRPSCGRIEAVVLSAAEDDSCSPPRPRFSTEHSSRRNKLFSNTLWFVDKRPYNFVSQRSKCLYTNTSGHYRYIQNPKRAAQFYSTLYNNKELSDYSLYISSSHSLTLICET